MPVKQDLQLGQLAWGISVNMDDGTKEMIESSKEMTKPMEDTIGKLSKGGLAAIAGATAGVAALIFSSKGLQKVLGVFMDIIGALGDLLVGLLFKKGILQPIFEGLTKAVNLFADGDFIGAIQAIGEGIIDFAVNLGKFIAEVLTDPRTWEGVQVAIDAFLDLMDKVFSSEGTKSAVKDMFIKVFDLLASYYQWVADIFQSGAVQQAVADAIQFAWDTLTGIIQFFVDIFTDPDVQDAFTDLLDAAFKALTEFGGALADAFRFLINKEVELLHQLGRIIAEGFLGAATSGLSQWWDENTGDFIGEGEPTGKTNTLGRTSGEGTISFPDGKRPPWAKTQGG